MEVIHSAIWSGVMENWGLSKKLNGGERKDNANIQRSKTSKLELAERLGKTETSENLQKFIQRQKVLWLRQSRMYGAPCDFSWGLHEVVSEEDKREVDRGDKRGWDHVAPYPKADGGSLVHFMGGRKTSSLKFQKVFLIVENRKQ